MHSQRVVVTGLGTASPHGDDLETLFDALMRGASAIRPVFPELPKPAAAATVAFDASRWFTKLQLAGVDRVSQLAVAAADLAMKDAGLENAGRSGRSRRSGSASSQVAAWAAQRRSKQPTAAAGACRR